ncbi:MAG: TatD family hydrolase, partial [Gammaproteobacteria bacterium]|nr:TatD family hydrolase [Gammaproteobacteria bacterium]
AAGVSQLVVTGASRAGAAKALALARAHPGRLFATAGIHPHHATECTAEGEAELRALLAAPEVVAAGECGLDYFRDFSPRPAQRRAFERQLALAVDSGKPVFLHQRDAHDDFLAILRDFQGRLGPAVVHCFTGSREQCFECLDAGYYIGLTGWLCDERRGAHLRAFARDIPAD